MNRLNKGRCSRCIASEKELKEIKRDGESVILSAWLKCAVKENWCRNYAGNCKEPPMGISAGNYSNIIKKLV
jgi:hypothetical protein